MAWTRESKMAAKIDEVFKLTSRTNIGINRDYDFTGVGTVRVHSVVNASIGNYNMAGASNRYGTPAEASNAVQSLTLSQDKAITFILDKRNYNETGMKISAQKILDETLKSDYIELVDTYRLGVVSTAALAAGNTAVVAVTSNNALTVLQAARKKFTNGKVPEVNRYVWASPDYLNALKNDPKYMINSNVSKEEVQSGIVLKAEGFNIIEVPEAYLPANCSFLAGHKSATTCAETLIETKINDKAPGISGWLVEARFVHDAFVMNKKVAGVYRHMIA